ncbi:hypothetical protein [Peribacillus kribbensis]|uniref:hypothetical protein n=1 Tax=Peribacillus kribbensis TaxID=356658 RepID=UPI0004264A2C|nr:hypothetical protein [Peribacillus kribbensis]
MDEYFHWIIGGILLVSMAIDNRLLRSEIAELKLKLDKIAKHIGVTDQVPEEIVAELKGLIAEGKRIKAIKRLRTVTGFGLVQAKEYIDSLISNEKT